MKYLKSFGLVILYILIHIAVMKSMEFTFYHSSLWEIESFREVIGENPHLPLMATYLISILIYILITKPIKNKSILEYIRFKKISFKDTLIAIYIGLGALIFNTSIINISFIDKAFPQFDNLLSFNYESSSLIIGILTAVIIGPLLEEFLFRGLIFNELKESIPLIPSVLISSLLYGVIFMDIPLMTFCFVAALLYTFVYIQVNSLLAVYVIDIVATLGVLVSRRLGIESVISDVGDIYMIPVFLFSIVMIVSGCYYLWKQKSQMTNTIDRSQDISVN
ncbi:CPBP family intramembrane metalloprotease [Ruminiclostridium herbifermentans]|uniref:CPBP family intramembrane metalloprotease n=1 Tax=Ruminiclostridium herbifermentans TaxID=2488810 RepID=A0A4U7JL36_9FIRM|nr:CPBP family intramembrane glutamic endopeptidase [Ruminiclostridium herbifermentans]QNU65938.1 CPBP family intramembrane metalloprotease [Ruminiclostridium herbifermentans]